MYNNTTNMFEKYKIKDTGSLSTNFGCYAILMLIYSYFYGWDIKLVMILSIYWYYMPIYGKEYLIIFFFGFAKLFRHVFILIRIAKVRHKLKYHP